MKRPSPADRFAGALLGTFAGDALGRPVEGMTMEAISSKHGRLREMTGPPGKMGRYSDDTQLMICVAESLCEKGRFDGPDLAARFAKDVDPARGYGRGTLQIVKALKGGARWDVPATEVFGEEGSWGNGAAMRVAPVGLFFNKDMAKIKGGAEAQARTTHTHPVAIDAAIVQAAAVALAYNSAGASFVPEDFLDELISLASTKELKKKLARMKVLVKEDIDDPVIVKELGNGIRADASVPTAIYCFLGHPDNLEEAIVHAVNLGGDTDTIAAMAGAAAGARNGGGAIPGRWISNMENDDPKGNNGKGKSYVINLAFKLHKMSSTVGG